MKSSVADYKTRIHCVRIVPVSGSGILRFAGYPTDITMSNSEVYSTENGYEFSGMDSSSSFSAAAIDLNGIMDQGFVTEVDLQSGVYDGARCYVFATSWKNPVEDEEPLGLFLFGKVELVDERYKAELIHLIDVLSQPMNDAWTPTCPWTLFDQTIDGVVIPVHKSRCTGPRSNPDGPDINAYKVSGTLTSVASRAEFADASRGEADDYFAYGEIMFTTGNNVGTKPVQVKAFSSGSIELFEPLPFDAQVGDEYDMTPGCRKRYAEDCYTKFNNIKNNGSAPHVPTSTQYGQIGRGA